MKKVLSHLDLPLVLCLMPTAVLFVEWLSGKWPPGGAVVLRRYAVAFTVGAALEGGLAAAKKYLGPRLKKIDTARGAWASWAAACFVLGLAGDLVFFIMRRWVWDITGAPGIEETTLYVALPLLLCLGGTICRAGISFYLKQRAREKRARRKVNGEFKNQSCSETSVSEQLPLKTAKRGAFCRTGSATNRVAEPVQWLLWSVALFGVGLAADIVVLILRGLVWKSEDFPGLLDYTMCVMLPLMGFIGGSVCYFYCKRFMETWEIRERKGTTKSKKETIT